MSNYYVGDHHKPWSSQLDIPCLNDKVICIYISKYLHNLSITHRYPQRNTTVRHRRSESQNWHDFLSSITDTTATGFRDDLNAHLYLPYKGYSLTANGYESFLENYTYKISDLSTLLSSKYVPSARECDNEDDDGPSAAKNAKIENKDTVGQTKLNCVLLLRKDIDSERCEYTAGERKSNLLQWSSCNNVKLVESERLLWNLMDNLHIYAVREIFKFMDYDQVKWMCDKDVGLSRMLAKERYGIANAEDLNEYPDALSVWTALLDTSAIEMRFHGDDALWMCTLGVCPEGTFDWGQFRRYPIKEGTYGWKKVATTTTVKQCRCCHSYLKYRGPPILCNEDECMKFELKGSEDIEIDTNISSVLFADYTPLDGFVNTIHMWTDDVENKWLRDMVEMNGFDLVKYSWSRFGTLFFKDPVKFFGVKKFIHGVNGEIDAIMSCEDCEVLGYRVYYRTHRFHIPANDKSRIIGLNFVEYKPDFGYYD